ncbi:MAG: hypothetical protein K1X79_03520 [Oligoflexia bacterium]|nr:hypothetical protein [Oligoflexia bacterium]
MPTLPGIRRLLSPYAILAVAVGVLALFLVLPWLRSNERFPTLAPGSYIGFIRGLEPDFLPLYVHRAEQQDDVLIAPLGQGWQPQVVSAMVRSSAEWELPLVVRGPGGTWQLIGKEKQPLQYTGTIMATQGAARGTWDLLPLPEVLEPQGEEVKELRLLLSLRAELDQVSRAAQQAEQEFRAQQEALDKLVSFMSDKEAMQASSEEKFKAAQAEFSAQRATLESRLASVSQAQEQLQVAQRVTAAGKLVALARESLERESRWAETMLRTSSESVTEGLGEAVARAREILEIRRQIEGEKNAIFRLKFLGGENGPSDIAVAQP